uniref:Cytochrome b n=1 Tax=Turneroconcha magnifica TaxID=3122228 RepID=A0A0U2QVD4_9BIVA|nr:cytochrome b [Calyptogena magnifica]ALP29866.1 cytochrome b [Calyptogena magnifica]
MGNHDGKGILYSMKSALYDLPVPVNLSNFWNFGSLLGVCLTSQLITGLLMAAHYTPDTELAFSSVAHIMRDVNGGWFIRSMHATGASFFFVCVYMHIGRGIYYQSYYMRNTWWSGCSILMLLMAISFTGYVLPWGQMSFWAATVITSMFSAIPYVGSFLVEWLWGGFCVGDGTLKRFYVFHFVGPFIMVVLVAFHIMNLHETGSSNSLGVSSDADITCFHSLYTYKDLVWIVIMLYCLVMVSLWSPDLFINPYNYIPASSLKTPQHIEPEWYFLFAYCILRSVPNKMGGVLALVASVFVLYLMPLFPRKNALKGFAHNFIARVFFWDFVAGFVMLSVLGGCSIDMPLSTLGPLATLSYFGFFIVVPFLFVDWGFYKK